MGAFHIYGFETKVAIHLQDKLEVDEATYVTRLDRIGFGRAIVLQRRNNLRRLISSLVAQEMGRWNIEDKSRRPELVCVTINPVDTLLDTLLDTLASYERADAAILDHLSPDATLVLTYEDDVADDPRVAYRKVCSFLGLRAKPAKVRLKKMNPYPVSDLLENYEAV